MLGCPRWDYLNTRRSICSVAINSCKHTCCTPAERRAVDPQHVAAAERAVAAQPRRGARRRRLGRRRRAGPAQQPRGRAAPVAPPQVRATSTFWRLVVLDVPLPTRQSGAPPGSPTIGYRQGSAASGPWCCGLTQGLSTQGVDASCKCLATCRCQLSLVPKLTARSSIRCSDSMAFIRKLHGCCQPTRQGGRGSARA